MFGRFCAQSADEHILSEEHRHCIDDAAAIARAHACADGRAVVVWHDRRFVDRVVAAHVATVRQLSAR